MYDINPGSNEVVPAEFINWECRNALAEHDQLRAEGRWSWDAFANDPSYWWRTRK